MRALGVNQVASLLPSQPRLVASTADHTGFDLLFYKHPPASATHDGVRLHTLVLHTGGVSHVSDTSSGRRQQAWTKEGSFTLTPAFEPVERSWKGRPEVLLIFLEPLTVQTVAAELDADPAKLELVPRLAVYDATLHGIVRLLLTELRPGGLGTALMLDCAARSIALHLLRRHSNVASPTPQTRPVLGRRLGRAIEFMRERLEGPIRLADLAEGQRS